jgi:O-antigen/teichoic acid export membrane protein
MALVRNVNVFMSKYAMVFSPTISSLQSAGRHDEVRSLMFKSLRYGLFIALPMVVCLLVFGDEVLRLWMGDHFVNARLIVTLQVGFLFHLAYLPLQRALAGLNLHGPPGWMSLVATAIALAATAIGLAFGEWTINEVAVAVGVPVALYSGVYLPLYTCRKLQVPVAHFFRQVWLLPLACMLPLALILVAARFALFPGNRLKAAIAGIALGALVLIPCYWRAALPDRWKASLLGRLSLLFKRGAAGASSA